MSTKTPLIDTLWADQHTFDIYKVLNSSNESLLVQSTSDKTIFTIKESEFNRFMIHLKPFYMTIEVMPGDEECINIILELLTHNQDGIQIYDWIIQEQTEFDNGYVFSATIDVALSAEPIIDNADFLESGIQYRVINRRTSTTY